MHEHENEPEERARLVLWTRLARTDAIGPLRGAALLARAGSIETIFALPRERLEAELAAARAPIAAAERLLDPAAAAAAEEEVALARERSIAILTIDRDDERYPELLRETFAAPLLLQVLGEPALADDAVAIVGARRCTPDGKRFARALARDLSRAGLVIVSGLARGIDAAAHEGALDAAGRTIAVLGSGVLEVYPPEHAHLADRIVGGGGAIVSELPPRMTAAPWAFPRRNRIVSGLSKGVLVVEAGTKSGALITARHAKEQGRDILAVPNHPTHALGRGTNALIRDGAALVRSTDDVLDAILGVRDRKQVELTEPVGLDLEVIELLRSRGGSVPLDDLFALLDAPPQKKLASLGRLEGWGWIVRKPGQVMLTEAASASR